MLKKVIKYEDFDGNLREEEFYFNLTTAEVTTWLTTDSDYSLDQLLEELTQQKNNKRIMEIFEDLILSAYGVKSPDGRKFVKTQELRDDFKATEAYSQIFTEVVMDGTKAAAFINAILPKKLSQDTIRVLNNNKENLPKDLQQFLDEYKDQPIDKPHISSIAPVAPMV